MSTITKERVKDILEFGAARIISPITDDEIMELARIALASLEPININDDMAFAFCRAITDDAVSVDEIWPIKLGLRAAFANVAAPPAPVSVPDYPETLPCPVMLEPGLRFGKGVPTKTMLSALQRRAEYYAELEAMTPEERAEYEAGMKEFAAMLQGADGALTNEEIPDA